jgi:hypothetical protein
MAEETDDGMGRFGGEKLGQHQIQTEALPDKHANSTGHETGDDEIVSAEFSGLDNDLVDMSCFDGQDADDDGPKTTNHNGNERDFLAEKSMDSVEQSVTRYDQSSGKVAADPSNETSNDEIDETSAGGLQYPEDETEGASP